MTKATEKLRAVHSPDAGTRIVNHWTEAMATPLSQEEIWAGALRIAELTNDYARIEEEKKFLAKELSTKLKAIRKEKEKLAIEVVAEEGEREVTIQEVYNLAEGIVYRVRADTGEAISRRKPTPEERQEDMFS